jgi:hypothetical protein
MACVVHDGRHAAEDTNARLHGGRRAARARWHPCRSCCRTPRAAIEPASRLGQPTPREHRGTMQPAGQRSLEDIGGGPRRRRTYRAARIAGCACARATAGNRSDHGSPMARVRLADLMPTARVSAAAIDRDDGSRQSDRLRGQSKPEPRLSRPSVAHRVPITAATNRVGCRSRRQIGLRCAASGVERARRGAGPVAPPSKRRCAGSRSSANTGLVRTLEAVLDLAGADERVSPS